MKRGPAHYFALSNALSYFSLVCGLGAVIAAREIKSWEVGGDAHRLIRSRRYVRRKICRPVPVNGTRAGIRHPVGQSGGRGFLRGCPGVVSERPGTNRVAIHLGCLDRRSRALCALRLTRLGFYNLHHPRNAGFVGLPTTLAGLIWSTLFLFHPRCPGYRSSTHRNRRGDGFFPPNSQTSRQPVGSMGVAERQLWVFAFHAKAGRSNKGRSK